MKTCNRCGRDRNLAEFRHHRAICKPCEREQHLERKKTGTIIKYKKPGFRICKQCKQEKSDGEFVRNGTKRRQPCKDCMAENEHPNGKLCVKCGKVHPISRYAKQRNQDGIVYRRNVCMDCINIQQAERKARKAGKIQSTRAKQEYFANADDLTVLATNLRWA